MSSITKNIFNSLIIVTFFLSIPEITFSHQIDFKVTPIEQIYPKYTPSISKGKKVFDQHCRSCHEKGKVPENSVDFWDKEEVRLTYTSFHYFYLTSVGRRKMPAFDFTEEEHWDAVFYIRSLITDYTIVASGKKYFLQLCSSCHGVNGSGGTSKADLKSQKWNPRKTDDEVFSFIIDMYQKNKSGRVKENIMKNITEENIWSIVDYIRSLQYQD